MAPIGSSAYALQARCAGQERLALTPVQEL